MTDHDPTKITHDMIVHERLLAASPQDVFDAWASTSALNDWCCPGDNGWTGSVTAHEFKVGGRKQITFGPKGGPPYFEDTVYLEVVPNERIIKAETILHEGGIISTSLITLTFTPTADGTDFTVTDQITLIGDNDNPDDRRTGWGEVLDKLGDYLLT